MPDLMYSRSICGKTERDALRPANTIRRAEQQQEFGRLQPEGWVRPTCEGHHCLQSDQAADRQRHWPGYRSRRSCGSMAGKKARAMTR